MTNALKKAYFELAKFEASKSYLSRDTITTITNDVRAQFIAAGIIIDGKLDARINNAAAHANNVSAQKQLTYFETVKISYTLGAIDQIADEIRRRFADVGIVADEQLEGRINTASIRANRTSAEIRLSHLENAKPHRDDNRINHTAMIIRHQFVAGGTELTDKGKLPNGLEARLNKAVTKAKQTARP